MKKGVNRPEDITQHICRHRTIDTTMGHAAVNPQEAIGVHCAYITHRRDKRLSDEYRAVTGTSRAKSSPSLRNARATPAADRHAVRFQTVPLGRVVGQQLDAVQSRSRRIRALVP
jgi:hypothetical protein